MIEFGRKGLVRGGLVALLLISWAGLAQAAYTKLYSFTNATGVSQTSVRAVTNGLESVTSKYSSPVWSSATGACTAGGCVSRASRGRCVAPLR